MEKYIEAIQDVKFRPKACVKSLQEFEIGRDMDCILSLNSGGAIFRDCVFTLKSIPNKIKQKFTAISLFPRTSANFVGCEFIGNETDQTAGLMSINANLQVSNSKF